ncbi:alpha/beta fold hydrolase [Pseudoalteromonas rubra]|nr:alpha/beta hydrolase [Pseudoalteromonas rubra]
MIVAIRERVCLIPGTMCDDRLWTPVQRHLSSDYQVEHIAIESQPDRDAMHQLIASHTAVQPCHLVGFSMGGYLALEHALSRQPRLRSLVLIATSAQGLTAQEQQSRAAMLDWLSQHPYRGMSDKRLAEFVHAGQLSNPEVVSVVRAMDRQLGQQTLLAQLRATTARTCLLDTMSRLTCPVLIIGAQDDLKVPQQDLWQMHQVCPGSQLQILPECGHMVPLERPAQLAKLMEEFFKSCE